MDAILVLDGNFRITRLNPRAIELFACTEDDLAGENFLDFLALRPRRNSRGSSTNFRPARKSVPLWLPEGLEAIRWDKAPVPAEAAISRYLYSGEPYYTVFLRSMSERLEAERRIRALMEEAESLRAVVGEAPGEMGIIGRARGYEAFAIRSGRSLRRTRRCSSWARPARARSSWRAPSTSGRAPREALVRGQLRRDPGVLDRKRVLRA